MAIFLFIVRLGQMLEAVEMSWEGRRGGSHDVTPRGVGRRCTAFTSGFPIAPYFVRPAHLGKDPGLEKNVILSLSLSFLCEPSTFKFLAL